MKDLHLACYKARYMQTIQNLMKDIFTVTVSAANIHRNEVEMN